VFFNFPDSLNRIQHVGIVEAVGAGGAITTIEGNTSSGVAGSQDRGGLVARRARRGSIVGYGHPAWAGAPAPVPAPARFDPNTLATLARGMGPNDSRVMALQRYLNAAPWRPALPLITTDPRKGYGTYGPATAAVVKAAQAQRGITGADANGETVGPRTKAAFAAFPAPGFPHGARW
jgi:hypothetical protein